MDKIVLDEWQKELLEHEGHLVLCTGRQVGKTTIMAHKAGKYMLDHPNCKIIVVSLTEDQAQLMIIMILTYLEQEHRKEIAKGRLKPTKSTIKLKNGSQVIARPVGNTGDAVRGFTADILIVDESARMPEMMWVAAKPTLMTNAGKVWQCSTPHGKEGYFYESFLNKQDRYKVFHISSEKVMKERELSESWTQERKTEILKFLEEERVSMSALRYGQEYLGLFLDDLRKYFSDELIEKVCCLKRRPNIIPDRIYSCGVDIARMGKDETAFQVLEKRENGMLRHVESVVTKKTLTTETEDRIRELHKIYQFEKIYIDSGSGSLGVGIMDHLLRYEDTRREVVSINNRTRPLDRFGKRSTRLLKEDLYEHLLYLMETGKILLLDDDNIKASLRSIQAEFIVKDDEVSQYKIFGNYSHCVEALIRSCWIAKEKNLNIWISSIKV